jgi:hypothetical protein
MEIGGRKGSARGGAVARPDAKRRHRAKEKRMRFRQETAREAKFHEKRRGVRVNSRVPVAVEWEEDGGAHLRREAHTRIVGPYGCLVVLPQELGVDRRVQLTNLANGQSNLAIVVWKGSERAEGWELGIELIDPQMDFWGLEL